MFALPALAALVSPAAACDRVDVAAPGVSVSVEDCGAAPTAVLVTPPPAAPEEDDDAGDEVPELDEEGHGQKLVGQYGLQLLPDAPGHQVSLRLVGEGDAYVGGELRYLPGSDLVGVGRAGAGLDLFGGGGFDLTLGLFVGGAGEWSREADVATLWGRPILGTEVAIGLEGHRLSARYRWLAGTGGGPLDELLTENEATIGYRVAGGLSVLGQFVVLDPGAADPRAGVGLGFRLAL